MRILQDHRRLLLGLLGLLVVAFGVALRLHELGAQSVWLDEAITWHRATKPVPELAADAIRRNHNPSYFLIMHHWLKLGDDEWMLRLPSVAFGALRLAAVIVLGALAGGYRVGLLAGLLLAVAPQQLRYDQEARMYAMFGLFVTLGLCGLLYVVQHPEARAAKLWGGGRLRDRSGRRMRWAYATLALGTAGALYSHNTAVFFLATVNIVALVSAGFHRDRVGGFARNWTLSQLAVLLLWAPWLQTLFEQAAQVRGSFWARYPTVEKAQKMLLDVFAFGHDAPLMWSLAAGLGLLALWAMRRDRELMLVLLLCTALGPALIFLVSLERPIVMTRTILWAGIPAIVLLAMAARALPQVAYAAGIGVLVACFGVHSLAEHHYGVRRKADWRGALAKVAEGWEEGALVLLSGGREQRQLRYYLGRKTDPLPAFAYADVSRESGYRRLPSLLSGRRDIWVIHRTPKGRASNTQKVIKRLRQLGKQVSRTHYGRSLHVRRFRLHKRSAH